MMKGVAVLGALLALLQVAGVQYYYFASKPGGAACEWFPLWRRPHRGRSVEALGAGGLQGGTTCWEYPGVAPGCQRARQA